MSGDDFAKNRKLLTNWWPVLGKEIGKKHFSNSYKTFLTLHVSNDRPLDFNKKLRGKTSL